MLSVLLALIASLMPFAQEQNKSLPFDVRANANLLFGKGEKSGRDYYDVVVTRSPNSGVPIKLPPTQRGGRFSFDLHHRISVTDDFVFPAEVTTVVQVISGGTNTLGTFTLSSLVNKGDSFDETINRTSKSAIDMFVTPLGRKTVTLTTLSGPQSLSIVGQTVTITRGVRTTRIDTPDARIATVSNFYFEDTVQGTPLRRSTP